MAVLCQSMPWHVYIGLCKSGQAGGVLSQQDSNMSPM